jgi:N-acetyl sugar amidotransferase
MKFKHANLEKQVSQLPKIVQWCKKCTISNQRPRIIFDKNGVCSGCNFADYKNYKINWAKREDELFKLLDKHRSKNGSWDVIVPSSGGKDSGYVAHQLKYKYGMNPVTVTWAPLEYTDIGWQNLQSKIRNGFDNFLYTPNGIFHRKLARLCFEELGDAFHVFVLGQVNFPFHMAIKLNIPLVFFGENGELEYSGDPKHRDKPFKSPAEWVGHYFKGVTFDRLIDFGVKNKKYMKDININKIDTKFYKSPSLEDFNKAKIKGKYFFSYFKKWTPQENFYYCAANTGFKPNPERSEGTYSKYASLDDKMDGFHYYLRYIKFGLGRCTEEVSHEIRDKHLSREEGKLLIKKYEGEFPKKYFQDFLNYLNISEKHFWAVCDSWRPKNLWNKKKKIWHLKHPVI